MALAEGFTPCLMRGMFTIDNDDVKIEISALKYLHWAVSLLSDY